MLVRLKLCEKAQVYKDKWYAYRLKNQQKQAGEAGRETRRVMTKTLEEKEQFIQLRARGWSFDKIAEKLEISKPTLLDWQGQFSKDIKEQQFFEYENLLEQYELARRNRFEIHSRLLNEVFQELERKVEQEQLSELSIPELLKLADRLETRLSQDTKKPLLKVELDQNFTYGKEEVVEL